ncbi:SAP domain-containing protein [Staphylococcus arlettae]|uniref:SAP domain-containing protein n=1 Tax=Staphylococcus arlettae TaxID=29378 RepID=UPI003CF3F473
MELNAFDILVLHKNQNRIVGKEILLNNCLAKNDTEIIQSIEKLISEKVLIKDSTLEFCINKLKIPDLKRILKSYGLKISGRKATLINRIINNLDNINVVDLELPLVYTTTEYGNVLLEKTNYLPHFIYSSMKLSRAYYIANNYINKFSDDKVFEIYNYEIEQMSPACDYYNDLEFIFFDLAYYFLKQKKDLDRARVYFNLCNFINMDRLLGDLINSTYLYYDKNNSLEEEKLKNNLITKFRGVSILETYKRLIFNKQLSNKSIYKLFVEDVEQYYEIEDREISELIINYLIAYIKNEEIDNAFTKVLKLIKDEYVLDPKDFEDYFVVEHDQQFIANKYNLKNIVKNTKPKKFNENDIEKYIKFVDENMIEIGELEGHCHSCGKLLDEIDLPEGPEKKVVCLNCLDWFIERYEELEEDEWIV